MPQKIILGIDEVGRGPWAGPLVVGAVVLGERFEPFQNTAQTVTSNPNTTDKELDYLWQHLADSKALTAKRRSELAPLIHKHAAATGLGWVAAQELDQYGLSASLKLATRRAVKQILAQKALFTEIIIDGTVNFLQNTPLSDRVTTLKKADSLIKEVSAAAIIAKVARDEYMTSLATKYPEYGFEQHVGYGTAAHKQALETYGVCPEHRTSFRPVRAVLNQPAPQQPQAQPNNQHQATTQKGHAAETAVASYLENLDHAIIAHNFKTKLYEIDLISIKEQDIFFTEVKYSQNSTQEITPLVRITPEKHHQMTFAAQAFLSRQPQFQHFQPHLAAASVQGSNFQAINWLVID